MIDRPTNSSGNLPRKHGYASKHRTRSHEQAHAQTEHEIVLPIFEHELVSANQPDLVATNAQLSELIGHLRSSTAFGYDTEFIGEHTYYPRLCVIQVASTHRVALIDPLADLYLKPFWELVADPGVEKIVHAGLHDLEPVMRNLERTPQTVFDTQVAAAFIGLPYPMATNKLILELIGTNLGGALKFSQWDHRPLSAVQLQYAANDVRYLPLLRHIIGERLAAVGNARWAAEECASFSDPALYQFDARSQRLRVRGVESLDAKQRAVLRSLVAWREDAARQQDVPPRTLLRDEIVLALASSPVQSISALARVRGLPAPVENRYGQTIVEATQEALRSAADAPELDEQRTFDWQTHKGQVNTLWQQVQKRCEERAIDPAIVASKKDVERLVRARARGRAITENRLLRGWRRELLGTILNDLTQ